MVKKSVCYDGGLVDAVIFVTRRNWGLFMHFGEWGRAWGRHLAEFELFGKGEGELVAAKANSE